MEEPFKECFLLFYYIFYFPMEEPFQPYTYDRLLTKYHDIILPVVLSWYPGRPYEGQVRTTKGGNISYHFVKTFNNIYIHSEALLKYNMFVNVHSNTITKTRISIKGRFLTAWVYRLQKLCKAVECIRKQTRSAKMSWRNMIHSISSIQSIEAHIKKQYSHSHDIRLQ